MNAAIGTHLNRHLQTALASLGRLHRQPVASLMTITVIAITLALPGGLHLILDSARSLSSHWDGTTSLSAFLRRDISESEGNRLQQRIASLPQVKNATLLTQQQALTEFSLYSGFDEALSLLEENPLPMVILIQPVSGGNETERVEGLLTDLRKQPQIEQVMVDLEWVKRLSAMTEIAQRGISLLSALLALAVLLVVGNTIRLELRNRQEEIIVIKQVGGTDAFVRRPFLYSGFWYGLFGSLGAWLLILLAVLLLKTPVSELAHLYQSDFSLQPFSLPFLSMLLLGGPLLGLLGAWLATGRQLSDIDPGNG